jgi:negative regulator of flagellin synthesis FlgM
MAEIRVGPAPPIGVEARTFNVRSTRTAGAELQEPTVSAPAPALDAGSPPIDAERVAAIRRAIARGAYPIVPARIGDAMIAAGILLRSRQS